MQLTKHEAKAVVEALQGGDAEAALLLLGPGLEAAANGTDEAHEAAFSRLTALLAVESAGEVVERVTALKAAEDKTLAETAALELSARQELVGELIKLGADTPAFAWEGDPSERKPAPRYMSEPVTSLRERVGALRKLAGPPSPTPPAGGAEGESTYTLTDADRRLCKDRGWTEDEFQRRMAGAVRTR